MNDRHNVLDLVTEDPTTHEVALIMVESRPWTGDPSQFEDLREKFKAYFLFAVDGELAREFPGPPDRRVRIQVDCAEPPGPELRTFIQALAGIAREYGIRVVIHVVGGGTPGPLEPA